MPLLGKIVVIERHGEDGTEFPFTAPCLFGRKLDCDIPIQLPQVSDEHCKIELNENNEFILTNLSSVNPTRINGQVLNQSERLKHGDLITIIDCSFRFEYPPPMTPTAGIDKTVQALQDQQEQSTPVHAEERKSEHSFDTCLKDGSKPEKTVDDMPSVGSITPSSTEKDVTPVSQKKRTPLKTPQKFSAGEVVQHIRLEPQPEEKTPKSPEGRRSVGSQDQSLDLQMPLGQPQTPGPVGKNTEVKMSPRTSPRSNAGNMSEVQGVLHEIEAIPSYRIKGLQVRTAEFIKMRADNDHLFTGNKNSASEGWR
ncbi:hypothetical protein R3I93_017715 [Phoxinus phoxinus]|uniref:FHA domain-containing protein n=1 Tax=Phoxinus phoxinus TaxID=58324 RepID=A0AAN9CH44_9TELE